MLFYTGLSRQSSTVLEGQKSNIESRLAELAELKKLANEAKYCLERGTLDDFGLLLHQGGNIKRNSPIKSAIQISTSTTSRRGRLAPSGQDLRRGRGGFLLLYCRPDKQDNVRAAMQPLAEYTFGLQEDGSKVIFNYRR